MYLHSLSDSGKGHVAAVFNNIDNPVNGRFLGWISFDFFFIQ